MPVDQLGVLLGDAVMFLWALLLGVWKYQQIATTEDQPPLAGASAISRGNSRSSSIVGVGSGIPRSSV